MYVYMPRNTNIQYLKDMQDAVRHNHEAQKWLCCAALFWTDIIAYQPQGNVLLRLYIWYTQVSITKTNEAIL